jgi:dipeptidyl aminopeptidase/acylaminoacyl peptidase
MGTHLYALLAWASLSAGGLLAADVPEPVKPARAATFTPELAIAVRRPGDIRLSPNGKRLAFTVTRPPKGATAGQEIWMLDVVTRRHWKFAHSAKSDRMPRWSPDGSRLAFLSDRGERAQVYLIPNDGGEAEALTEAETAVNSFEWSPDGRHIAFLAAEPPTAEEKQREKDKDDARVVDAHDKPVRLWVIEVGNKKVRKVTEGAANVESLCWAPAGDRLFVAISAHPRTLDTKPRVYTVALAAGTMREIHAPAGPIGDLQVSPDGKYLSFTAARGDGPILHDLFVLPVGGGEPRNLTAATLDRPMFATAWRKDGRLLAVTADGFRVRCLTVATDGACEPVDGLTVSAVGRVAWADTGLLAFVGQTATELPEIYLMPSGDRAERVTDFNAAFRDVGLVRPELIRYPSFDGAEVEAVLYRPRDSGAGGRAPLFVHVHGGPTGAFGDSFDAWAQLLAARGYAVLCPNVRGSTAYGWSIVVKNRADWGGGDFKDVMAGVDYLIGRGVADPDRLAIGGWSYGGYMAAWAITQTPRFKAAVVGACMSDLASEFGTEDIGTAGYDRWFNGVPYEKADTYASRSPVTFVRNARTPALILHGENDTTDPIGQAQQFYRGLRHYGVPCEFVTYPREGHGNREEKHQIDVLRRLVRWCDLHVKGTAGPPVFVRGNLIAWCIVPFDAKNRSPAERAAMVKRLGFTKVAYDWREKHVADFEDEIAQYRRHGIEYFAFWGTHEKAFDLFARYDMHPQIWQTLDSPDAPTQDERVERSVKRLLPIVERTAKMKCRLGLYAHGGWGGEPDNLVAVCRALREKHGAEHVGIVYNLHHGHGHIDDFAAVLGRMKPYLLCLNLNGMSASGPQILPLGTGEADVRLFKVIAESGYTGPVGIIGHSNDDVELRLRDNLDGLDWILPQLAGSPPGPRPAFRTR